MTSRSSPAGRVGHIKVPLMGRHAAGPSAATSIMAVRLALHAHPPYPLTCRLCNAHVLLM